MVNFDEKKPFKKGKYRNCYALIRKGNFLFRFLLLWGISFWMGYQYKCSTTTTTTTISLNNKMEQMDSSFFSPPPPLTVQVQETITAGGNNNTNIEKSSGEGMEKGEQQQQQGLAFHQSFGYFDTSSISDTEWKMRQDYARNATNHRYVDHPKRHWDKPNLWYYNNYDPIFSCPFQKRVRGLGDGPKWTCDPHRLKTIAQLRQEAGEPEPYCLLYSVGSNGNYQWEDGMYAELGGICEIHIFDFSQNYTREKNLERNMYFHQWGLQSTRDPRKPLFLSFPEILDKLGHKGKTIDIFKIDCEGCEWETFRDWIGYDIRQILVETHKLPERKSSGLEFFNAFRENNFLMFSKEVNPWGGGQFVEFSYIRLHPDFLYGHNT